MDDLGDGCIPAQYKDIIEKTQPYNPVPNSLYSMMPSRSKSSQVLLWSTVQKITSQAQVCDKESRDEMAWSMDVNKPVFKLDTTNVDKFSRLEYISIQTIDESTCTYMTIELVREKRVTPPSPFPPNILISGDNTTN